MRYLLALDQGTTSSRAALFDEHATLLGMAQQEHPQSYPQLGWVEHDPELADPAPDRPPGAGRGPSERTRGRSYRDHRPA